MAALYVIAGFVLMILSVLIIKKINDLKMINQKLEVSKNSINELNQQLDSVIEQLETVNTPLSKIDQISSKIIQYRR